MAHYDDGSLRAMLDNQAGADTAAINTHLAVCQQCRIRMEELQSQSRLLGRLLYVSAATPDSSQALSRFQARVAQIRQSPSINYPSAEASLLPAAAQQKVTHMNKPNLSKSRRWLAPLGALIVAIALLALPPVRAAADQLLQIFRIQTVMFVPVSQERMEQLGNLNLDGKSLFVAEPTERKSSEPVTVANAAEASTTAGFDMAEPDGLVASSYAVSGKTEVAFQVDVATAREILQLTGVDDISIPDALGSQPIIVNMSEIVMSDYASSIGNLSLIQGRSPQVSLPDGVDLAQLGKAALRILGMAPDQAAALSAQIDWSTTLIFPFPANINTMRQVSINGAPGMVITETRGSGNGASVYWQRGERFYVMQLDGRRYGDNISEIVQLAESVR